MLQMPETRPPPEPSKAGGGAKGSVSPLTFAKLFTKGYRRVSPTRRPESASAVHNSRSSGSHPLHLQQQLIMQRLYCPGARLAVLTTASALTDVAEFTSGLVLFSFTSQIV
jgi:hypothetical protein